MSPCRPLLCDKLPSMVSYRNEIPRSCRYRFRGTAVRDRPAAGRRRRPGGPSASALALDPQRSCSPVAAGVVRAGAAVAETPPPPLSCGESPGAGLVRQRPLGARACRSDPGVRARNHQHHGGQAAASLDSARPVLLSAHEARADVRLSVHRPRTQPIRLRGGTGKGGSRHGSPSTRRRRKGLSGGAASGL